MATDALRSAGHDVYILTWRRKDQEARHPQDWLPRNNIRIVEIDPGDVWNRFPAGPWATGLSQMLLPHIEKAVRDWNIDVVESTDYLFPAYAFFQKARTDPEFAHVVLSAFNHGLNAESYRANATFASYGDRDDLCSERQMLRLADVVLSPSSYAIGVLKSYGVRTPTRLVPEPFSFKKDVVPEAFGGRLVHLGRVSYAKDLDNLAFLINQCQGLVDIAEVYLVGSITHTPFREASALDYFRKRLRLLGSLEVVATGNLERNDALDLLAPTDFVCSLSRSETFSYSTLEALDAGCGVLAQAGHAVSELLPPDMSDYLLPRDLSDREAIVAVMQKWLATKQDATSRIIEYNRTRSCPKAFASTIETTYQPLVDQKAGRRKAKTSDRPAKTAKTARPAAARAKSAPVDPRVSVLVPAYNPGPEFAETIESLATQTVLPAEVVICDDGSSNDFSKWVSLCRSAGLKTRLVTQLNTGLLGARNTLIRNCTTELAIFLDCDDLLTVDAVERFLVAYETAGQPDAVISQRQNFGESTERVIRHHLNDHSLLLKNDYRMTCLLKTEVLRRIGFDGMRRNGEGDDWIFWLEFMDSGRRAEFIPEALFEYRFYSGSMSWPWSMGQAAGTADMISELIAKRTDGHLKDHLPWAMYDAFGGRYYDQTR